jgi:uncharacterized protein (DUF169 family)
LEDVMKSRIAEALDLAYEPVAVLFADTKPRGAAQFKERRWGCVIQMLAFAARGYAAVFDRATTGCLGGQVGLCFGDGYGKGRNIARFLSTGTGPAGAGGLHFIKSPALARKFVEGLPIVDVPESFVVLKALSKVDGRKERPKVIVFLADADQVAALATLANYDRPGGDAVVAPFASGCQAVCLLPFQESKKKAPRAVLGGLDLSARPHLDPGLLTFAVPAPLLRRMEANVPGSFLERETWAKLRGRARRGKGLGESGNRGGADRG